MEEKDFKVLIEKEKPIKVFTKMRDIVGDMKETIFTEEFKWQKNLNLKNFLKDHKLKE